MLASPPVSRPMSRGNVTWTATQDLLADVACSTGVMQIGLVTQKRNHDFDKYLAVNPLTAISVPTVWRYAASVAGPLAIGRSAYY
jgi:hypothetical protein